MTEIKPYLHKVQYYETDRMGVVHHSNYVRWMEEARVDFMDQLGFPYARMEEAGVFSPVTKISCSYKHASSFGDSILVAVSLGSFRGASLAIRYEMRNAAGELVCEAVSEHTFVNREGRIVRLRREMPEFCEALMTRDESEEERM